MYRRGAVAYFIFSRFPTTSLTEIGFGTTLSVSIRITQNAMTVVQGAGTTNQNYFCYEKICFLRRLVCGNHVRGVLRRRRIMQFCQTFLVAAPQLHFCKRGFAASGGILCPKLRITKIRFQAAAYCRKILFFGNMQRLIFYNNTPTVLRIVKHFSIFAPSFHEKQIRIKPAFLYVLNPGKPKQQTTNNKQNEK